jgi:hypothetical protein
MPSHGATGAVTRAWPPPCAACIRTIPEKWSGRFCHNRLWPHPFAPPRYGSELARAISSRSRFAPGACQAATSSPSVDGR